MAQSLKLKKVIAEIKAIIETNDLAGFVCLVEPGFSEYLHVINPSFSAAFVEGDGVRIKTEGLNKSSEEKAKLLETTANMFALLSHAVAKNGVSLLEISDLIDKKFGAEHTHANHTSNFTT